MWNQTTNINYVQLCEALEKGDKVTAQNLILNNVNVDTFNESCRYNWANIIYEALEISIISKVLQEKDKVIVQNLLLNDKLYPDTENIPKWQDAANGLFECLNKFRRLIHSFAIENGTIAHRSVLVNINNNDIDGMRYQSYDWINSIHITLYMFNKLFYSETLEEGDKVAKSLPAWVPKADNGNNFNETEFQAWTRIISETLDITIKRLRSNVNNHARSHNYYKLLNVAIQKNNTLEACLFTRKGARLGDRQIFEKLIVLLLGAIEQHNTTIAKVLIDYGVENNPSIDLIIPLNATIYEGQPEILDLIIPYFRFSQSSDQYFCRQSILNLEYQAKAHLQVPGNRYMFDMIKNGYRSIAQLFLDYNADIQYMSPRRNTLLHKAIENHFDINFIKSLLKLNPPLNVANHKMLTPLLVACKTESEHQLNIIKALIQNKANVNCADRDLTTPLHFACQAQNLEIVRILLKNGADPNAKNRHNQTPLHLLHELDNGFMVTKEQSDIIISIIKLLIKYHANIEAVDSRGWTPLFTACKSNHEVAVKYFLENHANVHHIDFENRNCLYVAVEYSFAIDSKVVDILLKYRVNVHCINKLGKSIMHHLVARDNDALIKRFASTQINFNAVDKQGNTPLHIAIEHRYVGMTKILLKYGADINILDRQKCTPFRKAIEALSYHQKKFGDHHYVHEWYQTEFDSDEENTSEWLQDLYSSLHMGLYKKIIRLIRLHIVKLKTAGLKISKQNWYFFTNYNDYEANNEDSDEDYISDTKNSTTDILLLEEECERELEKMKIEKIGVNGMTLYDLLTTNIHLLSKWARNKKLRNTLQLNSYNKKFPLYINIIRARFRDAKFRYRLMNPAKKYFSLNIRWRLPDDCIDHVFSYLKVKEINTFIRAIKRLDE